MPSGAKIIESVLNRRRFKIRLFIQAILVGLVSGSAVVMFRFLLEGASNVLKTIYGFLGSHSPVYTLCWIGILVLIGRLIHLMITTEPMIKGSGIPQTKGVLFRQLKFDWARVAFWKFVGGVLAIGSGLSLGREGPSVQIGAVFGQGVAENLHVSKVEEKILITCGASAGLAAAFNAPLAGVMFSLEELHKHFSSPVLLSAIAASVTADYVTRNFFGIEPVISFHTLPVMHVNYFPALILLGALAGLMGAVFNRNLIQSLRLYENQTLIPRKWVIAVPLILTVPMGFIVPEALGGGNELIDGLNQGQYAMLALLGLLVAKYALTMFSYGSGAPGGIFMPLLVIGALFGGLYSDVLTVLFNFDQAYRGNMIVFAMAAYFTAIVKAPITGSILITEMTGSFEHLLPLITVSMTAYVISDVLKSLPVYDQLLHRILSRTDSDLYRGMALRKTVVEAVIVLDSYLDGKLVKNVKWPDKCLLISVIRAGGELIPDGQTMLMAGDYVHILTSERKAAEVKKAIMVMAGHNILSP